MYNRLRTIRLLLNLNNSVKISPKLLFVRKDNQRVSSQKAVVFAKFRQLKDGGKAESDILYIKHLGNIYGNQLGHVKANNLAKKLQNKLKMDVFKAC